MPKESMSSHIAGGEITYICLGANQYQIQLNLYWDCTGGFDPGSTATINLVSTCGGTATLNMTQINPGGTDISQTCPTVVSSCSGGTFPGMNMNTYTGTVTLAPVCDTWTMSYSTCCRNSAIDNVSGTNYYIEATLNSATAPCNSSPTMDQVAPIPYVCANQPVNYSYGVTEPDGDSLYYSLVPALDAAGVPSSYYAGYSGTAPLPGATLNGLTGLLSFTPTTIGNYVFVILVQEYDANGNLVGTVMRDIQFVVQNCTNIVPDPTTGNITGFGGDAVQTGPYSLEMCAGNCFNFTATFTDPNPADVLTDTSNILTALPGAILTSSGTNPLTLNVSWCAPPGVMGQNLTFSVTISDGVCPIVGQQTYVYSVNILDATTASPDPTICGTQTAQLNAYGGSIFNWSVVSGPPMTPANFSCNPCDNPVASPNATTTYAVVSNLSGTCDNVDTVTVFVVPNFSYTVTQSSSNSCLQDPVQLDVVGVSPAGTYDYQWSPATNLSSDTIPNPLATFISPGSYTYTLTVTSPAGCVQSNVLSIVAAPAFSPVVEATNDTSFCGGGAVNLGVNFAGSSVPPTCGISASGGCGGTALEGTVGTGTATNTSTTWPAIFGNWYTSEKHQMLFTAAELNAAGVTGGKIDQLDFMINLINGITTYHQFTISMGCTSLNALGTTWVTGLVQVLNPSTVNVVVGWNTMVLSNAFEWDGISNIVVEVCSTEGPGAAGYSNYTNSCESPYTTTTFTSCLYSYTDAFDMCPDLTNFIQSTSNRPNVKFHYCSLTPDPSNFTYLWTPASGIIADSTSQFTTAMPTSSMDYYITVTNISGGCSDVDTVHVEVTNISTLTVTPAGPYCQSAGSDTLEVSVPFGTGLWSGPGITDDSLGVFSPSTAGAGTHEIIYAVNGACGIASDTIDITVTPPPDPTITPVPSLCVGSAPVTLSAVIGGGTWSGNGITDGNAGTYDPSVAGAGNDTVTYTITTPCYAQDTVVIPVLLQWDATITHTGPYCTSLPAVTLTAANPGGIWSGPGITDSVNGVFDPSVSGSGTHVIYYTIPGLCGAQDTDTIIVLASPIITVLPSVTEGCEPTTVSFTSTTTQPGGTCLWDFGDESGVANVCDPTYTYTAVGLYTVTLIYTTPLGCSDTVNDVVITIHSQPEAAYTAGPQPTTVLQPEINFTDISTGVVDQWHWTFGYANDSSIIQNPTYVYPDSGTYGIELIVTNIYGCADTTTGFVTIDQILVFYAPNSFSPNDNGNNDVFRVYGDGIEKSTFEMTIFNRWGERVFRSVDYEEGWNGARNNTGELVQEDVYVWTVKFKDYLGKKREYIGHVTIVK